jgi:uncharacterized protein with HEPN domain
MDHRILDCFQHMLNSIDDIEQFTHHMSFETYDDDLKTQAATERKFEIIGAALQRLGEIDEALLQQISDHRTLIDFRTLLAQGCDSVDNLIVWGLIETQLTTLKVDLCKLL